MSFSDGTAITESAFDLTESPEYYTTTLTSTPASEANHENIKVKIYIKV